jgi:hypothetical protein
MSPRAWGASRVPSGAARLLLLALTASLGGCFSERPTGPSGGAVSFTNDIQPILAGGCAFSGCHGTTNANPAAKPMVLTTGQAYDNIVNVFAAQLTTMRRITPGQPDNSYLIHKLQGTHLGVGGFGNRMPAGQPALSQTTINLIRTWVANGAPRN